MVVATLLAALPTGAVLAEQIRPVLPGLGPKPDPVKRTRRPFRPTLPARNPTRVSADITASAHVDAESSLLTASGAAAAGMAGASAAATVGIAGDALRRQADAIAATEPAREPETTAALSETADPAPEETARDDAAPAETATPAAETETAANGEAATEEEPAAETEDQSPVAAESITADAPNDVTVAEADGTGEEEPSADAAPLPPKETARLDAEPETAEAEPVEAPADEAPADEASVDGSPAADSAEEPSPAEESEPKETARLEPGTEGSREAEPAPAPDTPEPELVDAEPLEAPSHDATVVIDILPPPSAVEDEAPIELASVTPPAEPAPEPAIPALDEGLDDDTADDSAADSAEDSAEDAAPDSDRATAPAAADTTPSEAPSEATPAEPTSADDAAAPEEAAPSEEAAVPEDATPSEDAVVETAPPPPPAHPVIAAVRTTLADPAFRKGFNAATLEGLEEFYGAREGPPLWIADGGFSPAAKALIAEIANADDWGLDARVFDAPKADLRPATEAGQADAELALTLAVLKYARYAEGGGRSPASFSPLFDQKPELSGSKTLLTGIAAAPDPAAYLTSLHPQHAQFKALHGALTKARARAAANRMNPRNDSEVQLLVINMERWRWLPRNLGSYYVWSNVPEFNVRVMKGGKPIYLEKTIVGQLQYATPFFSAPMRNIVFHPNWTVPPTIVKEDLAPKLEAPRGLFSPSKNDMLRGYGLTVSYKGEPVDADRVDWANVNIHTYTFTQDPGPTNVLGKFKFNFPNRHAIYMHDTVQPELFAERTRTLSHGCIRVHDPDRFAALLLGQDKGWSYGQVERITAKNESTVISLNRKVPVHLTYFTATIDENGGLNRFGDIYGIDNRMAAKLFDNPARFPVPAAPVIAEQNTRSRDQGRAARSGGAGLDRIISGLFGN